MDMQYRFLTDNDVPEIYQTWKLAFAEYQVDMSYLTMDRMISRMKMDRVDFNLSVGAYSGNKMCGFLINGYDKIGNEFAAFDAGTGIIPEYRGHGIAGKMFDFALRKLKERGIQKYILEVIQENLPAIKAYQKAGFEIAREFNCYKIDTSNFISKIENFEITIAPIEKEDLFNYFNFNDWQISWEYNHSAILNIKEDLIINGAFLNGECVGFIVYNPVLHWIFNLAVRKEYSKNGIGSTLLSHLINKIKGSANVVKFNNVPPENKMCEFLEKRGFKIYTTQYEMIYYP